MTDEHKSAVPGTEEPKQGETPAGAPVADDWASAFAALEEEAASAPAGAERGTGSEPTGAAESGATGDEGTASTAGAEGAARDADVGSGDGGGQLPPAIGAGEADADSTPVDLDSLLKSYAEQIEEQATQDTLQSFLNHVNDDGSKAIRQTNGVLGATINDPDIYRVDPETKAVTFTNPDTGKPFEGSNPRAEAKAWVDAYNAELKEAFNKYAAARHAQLEAEYAPQIEMAKFAPVYEGLDPIRQKMLEVLIEDYAVYDADDEHVGYSCDLNKALDQVNRQVASIQATRSASGESSEPSGPALDMPNSGTGTPDGRAPKNLAEAMEMEQNRELEKLKKK